MLGQPKQPPSPLPPPLPPHTSQLGQEQCKMRILIINHTGAAAAAASHGDASGPPGARGALGGEDLAPPSVRDGELCEPY